LASDELLERIWAPNRFELKRDYVSLSELARRVQDVLPDDPPFEEVRAVTLQVLRGVAERNEAEFGLFRPKTFEWERWPGSPDELVAKVDADWRAYGDKIPRPGEILYLNQP
jgi:hypothetical protein